MDCQSNTSLNGLQSEGPWGGPSGNEWSYKPQCGYITQITIGYDYRVIESITFQSKDGKTEKFGGGSGQAPANKVTINIDYPNELLTGISGHTYRMTSLSTPSVVVGSLKLYTNRKQYGPFGQESGDPFSFRPKEDGAMITGFFGRAGWYMDAIGIYYKPCVKVPLIEDNSACIKDCQSSSSCNEEKSEGPWGGRNGNEWSYKPQCGYIKQITIGYSHRVIESITFQTQGGLKTEKFGGGSGQAPDNKVTINIDHPNEFLTGISGYTYRMGELSNPSIVLGSLKLYTNRKQYGPFGQESGDPFSFRLKEDAAMITGFFGRSGWYIDAIGVYYKDCQSISSGNEEKSKGPWGGPNGSEWRYKPQDGNIKQITVGYAHNVIESITFQGKDGKAKKFGGGSGRAPANKVNINIDYPNEFLTGISGYISRMTNLSTPSVVVGSLRFYTNRKQYGPFGHESGNKFEFRTKEDGEMISGFFGRGGWYIDAIGVYYGKESSDDLKVQKQGPWGGEHGQVFDDGVFSKIKQIHVHLATNNNAISAVQFEYVNKHGGAQWSSMHGGCGGSVARIEINSANEFLIGIQGSYGPIEGVVGTEGFYDPSQGSGGLEGFHGPGQVSGGLEGFRGPNQGGGGLEGFQGPNQGSGGLEGFQGPNQGGGGILGFRGPNQGSGGVEGFRGPSQGCGGTDVVKSLTFITNKGKYGPLGRETGNSFNSAVDNSKVVGFFGNYGEYLNAIGVHTKCL